jgi:hypothetical protein
MGNIFYSILLTSKLILLCSLVYFISDKFFYPLTIQLGEKEGTTPKDIFIFCIIMSILAGIFVYYDM